jgi:Sigma-70 region 2
MENNMIIKQVSKCIKIKKSPKVKADRLPWPRKADDNSKVELGIDVIKKKPDIEKIVHKFFKVDGYSMEDLLQEVYTAILHKNGTKSAHDPRKSSFGHYVYMIANNVCRNIVSKKKRYDREKESIFEPYQEDGRTIEESYEPEQESYVESENILELENHLRKQKRHELARFVRAARVGSSPDIIRAALSYGDRKMSHKIIRDMRHEVVSYATNLNLQFASSF